MQTINDRDAFATNGFPVLLGWVVVLVVAALIWPPLAIPVAGSACWSPPASPSSSPTIRASSPSSAATTARCVRTVSSTRSRSPQEEGAVEADQLRHRPSQGERPNGNPIEIGAVVVWRVTDSGQATFNVDDYKIFVANQARRDQHARRALSLRFENRDITARQHRPDRRGYWRPAGQARRCAGITDRGDAPHPPRLCPRNRDGHAEAPAGGGDFQARRYMVENVSAIITT